MLVRTIAVMCALLAAVGCACGQEKTLGKNIQVLRFGKLWDGKGKVWTNAFVIVDGERVREVTTDGKQIPAGVRVVDLSKY